MLVEIPKWIEVATCRLIYALRRKLLIVRPATFFVNQASWTCWTVGFNINPFSSENRAANQVTVASDVHRKTFSRMIQMSFRLPQHQQRFWYRVLHTQADESLYFCEITAWKNDVAFSRTKETESSRWREEKARGMCMNASHLRVLIADKSEFLFSVDYTICLELASPISKQPW